MTDSTDPTASDGGACGGASRLPEGGDPPGEWASDSGDRLSVVHIASGLSAAGGGPSRVIVRLTDALADTCGARVALISTRIAEEVTVETRSPGVMRLDLQADSRVSARLALPLRQKVRRLLKARSFSVVHSHGLWSPANHWTATAARSFRVPLVIHLHGTLTPWALGHKSVKKRIALALLQRRDLESVALFVATSESELCDMRKLGLRQPIALIPNGVDLDGPTRAAPPLRSGLRVRRILFLSRIHPVKGVRNLVAAWSKVRRPGWTLIIAGPDEGGHLGEVMTDVAALGVGDSVEYLGALEGDAKTDAYASADLFVLPSFTENFGLVVAEALACGVPVITTRGAPWAALETCRCGWWIDTGVEPLADALRHAMSLTDDERYEMGERGKQLARQYNWPDIARATAEVYRWLLCSGPIPGCVDTFRGRA